MAFGRWYPTVTELPDGRVVTMAGRDSAGKVVTTPEIWESNQWVKLPGAGTLQIPYYPRNFIDPKNGLVFMAGERIQSRWFDPDGSAAGGRGRWIDGPSHTWPFNRDYGTAAMYEPGKILVVGGGGNSTWPTPDAKSATPTATAEKIDLTAGTPTWQSAGSMSVPRRHLNSTILPDGQVLITGGTSGGGFVNIDEGLAEKAAEEWNPATNEWTTLASNSVMRVYHSVSILLPDATVLHGASGNAMAGGAVPVPDEPNHEIFSPPYLFKGARPTITDAPASVGYGQSFAIATPNAAQVTAVRWIHIGTVTHAFDFGQRANTLSFTPTATGVSVTAPSGPNLAPPGHYMLFVLNRNGVPSAGKIIKLQ
jgi:galactose oxidase-like protein